MQPYNFVSLKVVSFAAARAGVMQAPCSQSGVRRWMYLGIAPVPKCGSGYLKKGCVHISAQGVLYFITVPCNQV